MAARATFSNASTDYPPDTSAWRVTDRSSASQWLWLSPVAEYLRDLFVYGRYILRKRYPQARELNNGIGAQNNLFPRYRALPWLSFIYNTCWWRSVAWQRNKTPGVIGSNAAREVKSPPTSFGTESSRTRCSTLASGTAGQLPRGGWVLALGRTHFTKGLWAHNRNLVNLVNMSCSGSRNNGVIITLYVR